MGLATFWPFRFHQFHPYVQLVSRRETVYRLDRNLLLKFYNPSTGLRSTVDHTFSPFSSINRCLSSLYIMFFQRHVQFGAMLVFPGLPLFPDHSTLHAGYRWPMYLYFGCHVHKQVQWPEISCREALRSQGRYRGPGKTGLTPQSGPEEEYFFLFIFNIFINRF